MVKPLYLTWVGGSTSATLAAVCVCAGFDYGDGGCRDYGDPPRDFGGEGRDAGAESLGMAMPYLTRMKLYAFEAMEATAATVASSPPL